MKEEPAYFKLKIIELLHSDNPPPASRPLLILLRILSWLYGMAVSLRNFFYDRGFFSISSIEPAVLSVGNIVAGGTGKTPTVLALAQRLQQVGFSPAVICRGYGRKNSSPLLVSDGDEVLTAQEKAGDEPHMLARKLSSVPVVVCESKSKAAIWVEDHLDSDVVLIDDGFQHRSLDRDYDLVLLDSRDPFGNGHLLPRGFLREPPTSLARADSIMITRAGQASTGEISGFKNRIMGLTQNFYQANKSRSRAKIYEGKLRPLRLRDFTGEEISLRSVSEKKLLAFSGIGNPDSFVKTLEDLSAGVSEHIRFPDHHDYNRDELLERISSDLPDPAGSPEMEGNALIITTEKDMTKISKETAEKLYDKGFKLLALEVEMSLEDNLIDDIISAINGGR